MILGRVGSAHFSQNIHNNHNNRKIRLYLEKHVLPAFPQQHQDFECSFSAILEAHENIFVRAF